MNFSNYQEEVKKTAITKLTGIAEISYSVLGICGEAGEVSEKVKKIIRDKEGIISEEDRVLLKKEIGDVLWYLAKLSGDLGWDFQDVAQTNIDKCRDRQSRGVLQGNGDNR
jgi:NTP pyrophosphatase (non-canonical NTP hydrolase)